MVGTGLGARHGILVRDAAAIEVLGRLDTVVLDKTGTLTQGAVRVTDIIPVGGMSEDDVLRLAASAEGPSEHPLARAIVAAHEGPTGSPDEFTAIPGRGVECRLDGQTVLVGTVGLLEERGVDVGDLEAERTRLQGEGKTVSAVAVGGKGVGVIGLLDTLRPEAAETIRRLRDLGLSVMMITGDNETTARAIAAEAGIEEVLAEVAPADKEREIARLSESGRTVAMVGDGINDAPALARADVGIAIGTGTDVAMQAGEVTLVSGDLRGIVRAAVLGRKTLAHIRQNLFFAFGYNVAAIPLAAAGLLSPAIAAGAMAASSVSVVTNSLRLRGTRIDAGR